VEPARTWRAHLDAAAQVLLRGLYGRAVLLERIVLPGGCHHHARQRAARLRLPVPRRPPRHHLELPALGVLVPLRPRMGLLSITVESLDSKKAPAHRTHARGRFAI
jgi:hypothetical protein